MGCNVVDDDTLREAVRIFAEVNGNRAEGARRLNLSRKTFCGRLELASRRGLFGPVETMPGFEITEAKASYRADGSVIRRSITQKPEMEKSIIPDGMRITDVSILENADGNKILRWVKAKEDDQRRLELLRAAVDALKEDVPHAAPVVSPTDTRPDLLNLFVLTDAHLGMLAWREEAGADWDLHIAERTIMDWFAAAIEMAPRAGTAVLAQLGDLLHHDGYESKTPTSGHILDADSRLQKIIRVAIRCLRRVVAMLLAKHERVHIIMADANHDPASGAWLREMFAAFYEDEPRVTVDSSAGTYYAYEFGNVSLFMHHGHKRGLNEVDAIFAGRYRDMFGRTKHSYAHLGHLHSDALKATSLMKVERHETLAAQDAYAANGGFPAGRSAKVITYHRDHGEVSRITLTPDMVAGWSGPHAHA